MGNTIAKGGGNILVVGSNCQKITKFDSDIVISFVNLYLYKIVYNNSKYGKIYLAATNTKDNTLLAQNKDFNFSWEFVQNEDTEESFIFGNHTRKCEKNSLAITEIFQIESPLLNEIFSKVNMVPRKFKNDSDLDKLVKTFQK
jgi:hypothetical protein